MIKFLCTHCGKKIGAPDEYADKLVKCPRCEQPARVPGLKLEWLQEDDSVFPVPGAPAGSDHKTETEPPEFDSPVQPDPHTPVPEKPSNTRCPQCLMVIPDGSEFCVTCGHPAPTPVEQGKEKKKLSGIVRSVPMGKGFVTDLLSMINPVKSWNDAIVFFFLFLFHTIANIPFFVPWYVKLVTLGLIYTYLFDILLETANGGNDLPMFEMPETILEAIKPFFQILASGIYAFLPLIIWMVVGVTSASNEFNEYEDAGHDDWSDIPVEVTEHDEPPPWEEPDDLLPWEEPDDLLPWEEPNEPALQEDYFKNEEYQDGAFEGENPLFSVSFLLPVGIFCVGVFFWPMIVLNIVLGNVFFPNPVKLVQNIGRTFKPYLICCGMMYLTSILIWLSIFEFTLEGFFGGRGFVLILAAIASLVGSLCVEIYAMRVLGLLYRHYEDKLDW